ncbi:MAG: Gfo/Idh/MocA family oxidoreductase, partial [Nanoarchaeota archaeon]|nr:Gfo/Idh/MocA family oxidoreductase [Nanoarchaeota archaeon]
LIEIAEKNNLILMVGHIFTYHPAITELKKLMDSKELGKIEYIYSIRVGPGPVRNNDEVNALWDLAPHDISIFLYLLGKEPDKIKAFSSNFLRKKIIDSASFLLKFGDIITEAHVRWWDAEKIRKFTIIGDKKIAVFDESSTEKLKIYNKRIEINNGKTKIIDEGMFAPNLDTTSPLEIQCRHFLDCIKNNKKPLTDGKNGYNVVKILEDIENSF